MVALLLPLGKGESVYADSDWNSSEDDYYESDYYEDDYYEDDYYESDYEEDDYDEDDVTIQVGEVYSGTLSGGIDFRYYCFTIPENGAVSVTFNHPLTDTPNCGWDLELLNETKYSSFWKYTSQGHQTSLTTSSVGLPNGKYYLKISSAAEFLSSDSTYTFAINYTPSSSWETEYNEEQGNANYISVNKTYSGNSMHEEDQDCYWFTIDQTGTVSITFEHPFIASIGRFWSIQLLGLENSSGESKCYSENGISGIKTSSTTPRIGLQPGTYCIKINSSKWNDSVYNFKVNFIPTTDWELETKGVNPLVLGKSIYGCSSYEEDVDKFVFELSKGSQIKINFEHDNINDPEEFWDIVVQNGRKETIKTYTSRGDKKSTTYNLGYLSKGKYYISISPTYGAPYGYVRGNHSDTAYKVKAFHNVYPQKTKLTSATATKSAVVLKWSKSNDATGYEIYRATSKNGKYKLVKKVTNRNTLKYTDKKVKKNRTYYYKIRSYKTVNKTKYETSFSVVKGIKVKK